MKNVMIYLSFSPLLPVSNTHQLFHLMNMARDENFHVCAVYEDNAYSTNVPTYDGLKTLFNDLESEKFEVDYLLIYDASILGTELEVYLDFVDMLHEYGVTIITLCDHMARYWESTGELSPIKNSLDASRLSTVDMETLVEEALAIGEQGGGHAEDNQDKA